MKRFFGFLLALFAVMQLSAQSEVSTLNNSPVDTLSNDTLLIVGVGDIMLGTIIPTRAYLPPNEDCSGELLPTSHYFKEADVAMCNLEGVLTDSPEGRKSCSDPSKCYTFGMPTKFAQCLVDAGFDLISVANNHTKDFGTIGKASTAKTLEAAGLQYAGWITKQTAIFVKDSITYGFCAFSPESANCDINDIPEAQRLVRSLDSICDVVIVSFHSGAEGAACQHVPKQDEMFMGYNRGDVYKFSHAVIDAGADIVFGHGPHVSRAVEVYNDRFIAYSMGNFCTYSSISVAGVCGLAPIMRVYTDKTGKFYKAQIVPTYQIKSQPPAVDAAKKVLTVIKDLTKADFPDCKITIDDEGWVTQTK